MDIRVGEYVRTKYGEIGIITKTYPRLMWRKRKNSSLIEYSSIIKHSKDIIDLVEVGDYVNGNEITEISQDPFVKGQINLWTDIELRDVYGDYERLKYICDDIKTIVTKEQFSQMEYKLEE